MSFSEIVHGLWVGSRPRQIKELSYFFDTVILTAKEWQPPTSIFGGLQVVRAPMRDKIDSMPIEDKACALRAAQEAAKALSEKRRVLITCWEGLNRSSLIAALVLTRPPFKMRASEAITRIRSMRSPCAFSNPNFEKFLYDSTAIVLVEAQL
jgi:protein-tyrosine phosphatase